MEIFSILFFDIFLDELIGDRATGDGAVPSGPEVSSPEDLGQMWVVIEQRMCTLALQVLHHIADREFWRIRDEEVDVIRSDLPREDMDVNLGTESPNECTNGLSQFTSEHSFPVLGYPDEMHLQIVFAVATGVIGPRHGSNSSAAHLGSEGPPKGVGLSLPPLEQ